jgi:flagellar L-ring protein precursor FlgH
MKKKSSKDEKRREFLFHMTDLSHAPWLATGKQISRGFQGGMPFGRRARVDAPPEKGRQGASMEWRRPSEEGKRSCSPSELTLNRGSRINILWGVAIALSLAGCSPKLPPPPPWTPGDYVARSPSAPISEGSLWHEDARLGDLYGDLIARHVGDVVTIKVVENSEALKSASTETARGSSLNASVDTFFGAPLDYGGFQPEVSGSMRNEFEGQGTTTRKDTLVATLTAKVVDVLPGGLLRIEGYRDVTINNERQYLLLRGVIRPVDIAPDNSVFSSSIADAQIAYAGNGVVSDKQRPGWFTRILDYTWPF